jgi:hypothetical protein
MPEYSFGDIRYTSSPFKISKTNTGPLKFGETLCLNTLPLPATGVTQVWANVTSVDGPDVHMWKDVKINKFTDRKFKLGDVCGYGNEKYPGNNILKYVKQVTVEYNVEPITPVPDHIDEVECHFYNTKGEIINTDGIIFKNGVMPQINYLYDYQHGDQGGSTWKDYIVDVIPYKTGITYKGDKSQKVSMEYSYSITINVVGTLIHGYDYMKPVTLPACINGGFKIDQPLPPSLYKEGDVRYKSIFSIKSDELLKFGEASKIDLLTLPVNEGAIECYKKINPPEIGDWIFEWTPMPISDLTNKNYTFADIMNYSKLSDDDKLMIKVNKLIIHYNVISKMYIDNPTVCNFVNSDGKILTMFEFETDVSLHNHTDDLSNTEEHFIDNVPVLTNIINRDMTKTQIKYSYTITITIEGILNKNFKTMTPVSLPEDDIGDGLLGEVDNSIYEKGDVRYTSPTFIKNSSSPVSIKVKESACINMLNIPAIGGALDLRITILNSTGTNLLYKWSSKNVTTFNSLNFSLADVTGYTSSGTSNDKLIPYVEQMTVVYKVNALKDVEGTAVIFCHFYNSSGEKLNSRNITFNQGDAISKSKTDTYFYTHDEEGGIPWRDYVADNIPYTTSISTNPGGEGDEDDPTISMDYTYNIEVTLIGKLSPTYKDVTRVTIPTCTPNILPGGGGSGGGGGGSGGGGSNVPTIPPLPNILPNSISGNKLSALTIIIITISCFVLFAIIILLIMHLRKSSDKNKINSEIKPVNN